MLKEVERIAPRSEIERRISVDAVVVGSGVLGLIVAKKLGDLGQSVVLLESSNTIADGASIRNHGWLHRGSSHAVSVKDKNDARKIVQKLIYGYEFIRSYVPEAIEEPFDPIFAYTKEAETAERAQDLWKEFEVWHREISRESFLEYDENIRRDLPLFFFQTADLKINNRILFQKLANDIRFRGNTIITGARFDYEDFENIRVDSDRENIQITAEQFIYCTGLGLDESYRSLTGENLGMNFWKSHLIIIPKFSPHSMVSLDRDLPIIINHGDLSVVNRAYDEYPTEEYDKTISQTEVELAFRSASHLYPGVNDQRNHIEAITCSKPSIQLASSRHSVNSQILSPVKNHLFALPGKMTESPYVADEIVQRIYSGMNFGEITPRPLDKYGNRPIQAQQLNVITL